MAKDSFSPILVPWDFSEHSKEALSKAIEIADSPDEISVVHVATSPSVIEPGYLWEITSSENVEEACTQKFSEYLAENVLPVIAFTVRFGDPGIEITEFASEMKAQLIVISSHGRTGLSRLLLGSVAERVIRFSTCAVLVIRSTTNN